MLADQYVAQLTSQHLASSTPEFRKNLRERLPHLTEETIEMLKASGVLLWDLMSKAQRFVLSPHVVSAALDLSESPKAIENSRDYLFLPARYTWIEWTDNSHLLGNSNRFGVLLDSTVVSDKSQFHVGVGTIIFDEPRDNSGYILGSMPFMFDFPGDGPIINYPMNGPEGNFITERFGNLQSDKLEDVDAQRLGAFIAAALALINTPRISQIIPHDLSRLNASRIKSGKPPLMSWSDVNIRPDCGWEPNRTHQQGKTGEKRRHHVRTFLRMKRGMVEMVGAHWRGNRAKGYVQHRHIVSMEGEEAGIWKGEPLPGDEIMEPGYVAVGDDET